MTSSAIQQGMCPQRLARIDDFLKTRYIASGKLPHTHLVVARAGQVVHRSLHGQARLATAEASAVPLTEDTLTRLNSMTKPITSVAFMMLVEEGKVALDDPVHSFIPSWRNLGVYVSGGPGMWVTRPTDAPMRIIDLLRHTSGLTIGLQMRNNVDAAYRSADLNPSAQQEGLQGLIDGLAQVPLVFSPGTAWNYSLSTDVLGHLVEVISGQPFAQFLQQRIFGPLGMVDTAFHVSEDKLRRFSECYIVGADGKLAPAIQGRPTYKAPPAAASGASGLVSTMADFLRFCELLRRGGEFEGVRLLGPKTLQLMRSNHLPGQLDLHQASVSMFSDASFAGVGFGLGFAMNVDVAKIGLAGSLGSYWWGGLAGTLFWIDPVEDLSVVFFTQLIPSTLYPIRRELFTLVNAAIVDSKA
ncbi:MAG: serine hydrolase domain-containing protein [Pseudomonadota bacterium]